MKRYKLVREYPGSPKLGSVVWFTEGKFKSLGHNNSYKLSNTRNSRNYIFYEIDYIEDYPKFWKKLENNGKKA